MAIARFAVHSREHLALVRPTRGILTLSTLYYPEEIREVAQVVPAKPNAKFLDMAATLIEQQTITFEPEAYQDRYKVALEKMLEEKQPELPPARTPETILNLLEALQLSVEKAKKQRSA